MSRLLSLLIVLLFIAPALLARGAEMHQSVRGADFGAARPARPVAIWQTDRGLGVSAGRRWLAVRIRIQVGGVL